MMNRHVDVRPSAIAGKWYPADPQRLREGVQRYLDAARLPEIDGQVIGVMAPHAGHRYSGPTAGYAFAAVRGLKPDLVVVVSPVHYAGLEPVLTSGHVAYETPLGSIPVDEESLQALNERMIERLNVGITPVLRDPEHSLEIELPFLQVALEGSFSLLPLMVRDTSPRLTRELGNALAELLAQRSALLVASSDLSHFYPQPVAERLDANFLARVEAFDPAGVLAVEEAGQGFACGRSAVATVLWAALGLGASSVKVLNYSTSGMVTGDFNRVVGYAAAVITRPVQH